jgi:hypothetical protein
MIIECKSGAEKGADPKTAPDWEYWARRGSKTGAFLLVIPGCAIIGARIGMLMKSVEPYTVIGFGAGLLVWGIIVAVTD